MLENPRVRAALGDLSDDVIVFDIEGIAAKYALLKRELPGVSVRFAIKACPVPEVLDALARCGAGFDAASPNEIALALRAGARVDEVHYGNTIKSHRNIADGYHRGIRDFATDSLEDVMAIAVQAAGSRVFCRLAMSGEGAVWGLGDKFGCSPVEAVTILRAARTLGLVPAGLSFHVGSQQMTAEAWQDAFDCVADLLVTLRRSGITPDHVNLGGGLPALGYLDRRGWPLEPPVDRIFTVIRDGMRRLANVAAGQLDFIVEPGRFLVADHGAIRAHVSQRTSRRRPDGALENWLYLSCGKFNGLYEMDQVRYRLVFPTHVGAESMRAVVAGPSCDRDDVFDHEHGLVEVPRYVTSGDPVWILSCGGYSVGYMTQGFNGFEPLASKCVHPEDVRHAEVCLP
jgi:ornithine decarboxylase